MDKKCTENIDVERCKELFAYEMTEVLLMLKGEFAAVSGKNLGLSQYFCDEENQVVPRETIVCGNIPDVEIRKVGIPDELTDKLTMPIGNIRSRISACEEETRKSAIQLDVELPSLRSIPRISPVIRVETASSAVMPEIPSIQIPQSFFAGGAIAQAPAQTCPESKIRETFGLHPQVDVPPVPHFDAEAVKIRCKPIAVEIPRGRTAVQWKKPEYKVRKELESDKQNPVQGLIPKVPVVSIPKVTCSAMPVAIPAIGKVSGLNMEKKLMHKSADQTVSRAVAHLNEICSSLSEQCTAVMPRKETRDLRITLDVVVPESTVPDIPHLGVLEPFKMENVRPLSSISVPEKPDIKQELTEILCAAVK